MATVEQCETQPSGLGGLSSTLDLFDSYKPLQEEDKDSDEESFHLPMLDCDDDLESNSKEVSTKIETEDDILDKFATTGTPDLDPKVEDSILEDIEELCIKKPGENITERLTEVDNSKTEPSEKKQCVDDEDKEPMESSEEIAKDSSINIDSTGVEEPLVKVTDQIDEKVECKEKVECEEKMVAEGMTETEQEVNDESKQSNKDLDDVSTDHTETEKRTEVNEIVENNIEEEKTQCTNTEADSAIEEEVTNISELNKDEKNVVTKDQEPRQEGISDSENLDPQQEKPDVASLSEKMDVDIVESETEQSEINTPVEKQENTSIAIENVDKTNDLASGSAIPEEKDNCETMDVEHIDGGKDDPKSKADSESIETIDKDGDKDSSKKEELIKDKEISKDAVQCENKDENKLEECNTETNTPCIEKAPVEPATVDESKKEKETGSVKDSKVEAAEPDKCENSNDSSKSQNLDCDDLFDISIIRDADEDNASAIAENANDARSCEKSDIDYQDEESEKADNELDESEVDQEENLLVADKDDNMDFEDENSSNLDQDNTTSGNTSDSGTNNDIDMRDSENDSKESSVLKEKTNQTVKNVLDSEKTQTDEPKDVKAKTEVKVDDSVKENSVKSGKRSLSETDKDTDIINKKIKLSSECPSTEEKKSTPKNNKAKTLITFEKYMQNKKLKTQLSRSDLEQFCLQKICEAIMHKTDVGELHQTIKKQELIIENLRKDLQQLTKQTRDLDIVNKKLMNELKVQNGNKKPLVPLKITRSVGLQVKLNLNADHNIRRKAPVTTTARTPSNTSTASNTSNTTPRPRTITPANQGVVRQVAQSPRKTPTATPLLSQALQSRQSSPANAVKRTPIRPKPAEPQKPATQSVIDLTDEDDKAAKSVGNPVKVLNKTIPISQTKTINIVQAKTVANKTLNNNQNKTVAVGQVKNAASGAKAGTPTRTVTTLPQGVRLTPTQVKNGSITIPASVVTSNSGTTQLMYVVQPTSSLGQVVTTTAGGAQKAVLLNFQPTNGVLTSALNGSAVSVIPTKTTNTVQLKTVTASRKHPAPLPTPPPIPANAALKPLLPKPHLSIRKTDTGIILQWRMPYNLDVYEGIASYQLFAYQETNAAPSTDMWRKVGDVKALALPMACTLTQFADKNKYYFAVRSVDVHKRIGAFSDPEEISL